MSEKDTPDRLTQLVEEVKAAFKQAFPKAAEAGGGGLRMSEEAQYVLDPQGHWRLAVTPITLNPMYYGYEIEVPETQRMKDGRTFFFHRWTDGVRKRKRRIFKSLCAIYRPWRLLKAEELQDE